MNVFISIDGVLRDIIGKFDYYYKDHYFNSDTENEENFEYKVYNNPCNDDLKKYYSFQDELEFKNFLYVDYALEIFGHAYLPKKHIITELNDLMFKHKNINFYLIGLDEYGKAKPATLFFLSKNGFLGNNIIFIKTEEIKKLWESCDIWITDNETIIYNTPKNKISVKVNNQYNSYFNHNIEINEINEIEKWLIPNITTKNFILMLKNSLKLVYQKILLKMKFLKLVK